jgi:hypothetical protein
LAKRPASPNRGVIRIIKTNNLNGKWPPNRGFIEFKVEPLNIGTDFDRYGGRIVNGKFVDNGNFAAPKGISFESRALPADYIKPIN